MEDRNKWILIGLQFFHVVLFLAIAIAFGVPAFGEDFKKCYFPCTGEATPGQACVQDEP